jgi:hypothetical protein
MLCVQTSVQRCAAWTPRRDDRAITGVQPRLSDAKPTKGEFQRVMIWGPPDAPTTVQMRDGLAVAGYRVSVHNEASVLPPADVFGDEVDIYVLHKGVLGALEKLRTRSKPVMVYGLDAAAELAATVRLGADDAILVDASDEQVAKKVWRLLSKAKT